MADHYRKKEYRMRKQNLEWIDPEPPKKGTGSRIFTEEVAGQLKENPGRWARIACDVSRATATNIKKKHPAYEVVGRTAEGYALGRADIYVRYIGENGEYR